MTDQDDVETFVTAGSGGGKDRCIARGKPVDDDGPHNNIGVIPDGDDAVDVPPEYPHESFWLSKDAEYDWFDRNAFNYERKESTKGNSNTNINPSSNYSSSQRFHANLKSKASIIGLPKIQKAAFVDTKRRTCKPTNIRLFPKRSDQTAGKSTVPVAEPGSPKVSCMGRVRSKRGRRRLSNSLRRSENPGEKTKVDGERQNTGFCSCLISMFRSKKGHRKTSELQSESGKVMEEERAGVLELPRRSVSMKMVDIRVSFETVAAEPPCLGGMKRFSSGRRSGSWTAEDFNQAVSVSLESEPARGSMSRN